MIFKLAPIIEQLIFSGLNLIINIAFIAVSSKEEFGVFSILNSYLLLAISLQTATFSVPVTVEISRLDKSTKNRSLIACSWAILPVALILAIISALILYAYFELSNNNQSIEISVSFAAAIFATWIREFSRTLHVLHGNMLRSFLLALIYATIILTFVSISLFTSKSLSISEVFWFISIASLLSSPDFLLNMKTRVGIGEVNKVKVLLTPHTKWAFPGVLTSWIQNNAYLSIVGGLAGVNATADIAAARLFIMPYMTGFSGFGRLLIKRFSEDLGVKSTNIVKKVDMLAISQLLAGSCLAVFFYVLNAFSFGELLQSYGRSLDLAVWWGIFAGFACAKSVYVMFAQSNRQFKALFVTNLVAAFLVLIFLFLPVNIETTKLAIFALIAGEAATLVFVWYIMKKNRALNGYKQP